MSIEMTKLLQSKSPTGFNQFKLFLLKFLFQTQNSKHNNSY